MQLVCHVTRWSYLSCMLSLVLVLDVYQKTVATPE